MMWRWESTTQSTKDTKTGFEEVQGCKDALRHKTRRSNGHSLAMIVVAVNVSLMGWFAYFKHGHPWTFVRLDRWLRRRLRSILRKGLHKRGISRGHDHYRWPNQYFWDHGLISLEVAHRALPQSS